MCGITQWNHQIINFSFETCTKHTPTGTEGSYIFTLVWLGIPWEFVRCGIKINGISNFSCYVANIIFVLKTNIHVYNVL